MSAIYGNIYHQYTPNVSIYTIHGSYGYKGSIIYKGSVMVPSIIDITTQLVQCDRPSQSQAAALLRCPRLMRQGARSRPWMVKWIIVDPSWGKSLMISLRYETIGKP